MAGFIKSDVKRAEVKALNTKVDKEIFNNFKDYCKYLGYPMNVLIETFMNQFANGEFNEELLDIKKISENSDDEKAVLNTTFNKEIYTKFKDYCKERRYFVNGVITAFMKEFADKKYVLKYEEKK